MRLTDHVHALKIPFTIPIAPDVALERFVYAYIIFGNRICVVDTGVAGSETIIAEEIAAAGRQMEEIALVAHTHTHPDHIGSTAALQQRTGCTVAAHPAERTWIEDVSRQAAERPVPGFHRLVGGSARVDRPIVDGDVIDLGGCTIEVIATPGHSPGSVSFLVAPDGVLCSGDAVPLSGEIPIYDDALASAASVRRLMACTDVQWLCSAWDDPCEGAAIHDRMEAGLLCLKQNHDAVRQAVKRDIADPWEVARQVCRGAGLPPEMVNPLVLRSIAAHLRVRDSPAL